MHFSGSLLGWVSAQLCCGGGDAGMGWEGCWGGMGGMLGWDGRMPDWREGCSAVPQPLPTLNGGTNPKLFIAFSNFLDKTTNARAAHGVISLGAPPGGTGTAGAALGSWLCLCWRFLTVIMELVLV